MIKVNYKVHKEGQNTFRPTLLDEHVIRLRRLRFDAILSQLKCDNSDHSDFENMVSINVSPTECFLIEKACCNEFEEKILNALMETCKK